MSLRLCQIQYGTTSTSTGQILFSISTLQEVSVKSKKRHFAKNWNDQMSGIQIGGLNWNRVPSWSTMHLEVDQKYYLHQKKRDGLVHPVLDSFDKYKILSERMNVLTIYLPCRKLPVASNLSTVHVRMHIVKTAVSGRILCCPKRCEFGQIIFKLKFPLAFYLLQCTGIERYTSTHQNITCTTLALLYGSERST